MTTQFPAADPTDPRQRLIDVAALTSRLQHRDAPRLLDVRSPAEFQSCHIPGAYNVPLDTLKEHREELVNHLDDNVVLVCRSGQRANQAAQALAGAGLPNLQILSGGLQAWEQAGAPVNRGAQRWDLERQVRLVAGSLVLVSTLASTLAPKAKWLAAGVGGGLTLAALSNTCVMGNLLAKLPYNRAGCHDVGDVVAQLAATSPAGAGSAGPVGARS